MVNRISTLLPPANLSVAYAPAEFRAAFGLLLEIDDRLQRIVTDAREPMIAQIKLAWWREAFSALPQSRPKGEPLLQALNEHQDVIQPGALESLVSAWEVLLGSEQWEQDVIGTHARLRAEAIFESYGQWVGATQDLRSPGEAWAVQALQQAFPSRFAGSVSADPADVPKGRKLRPLSILMMSVQTMSGPRLVWHALTGL